MKEESRYKYTKRIEGLNDEIMRLRAYKVVATRIYDTLGSVIGEGKQISHAWILAQYRELF